MTAKHNIQNDASQTLAHHIRDDDAAFERYFKKQFAALCAWCAYKYPFDTGMAREVVHMAFIKLWKTRATLLPDEPVMPFLQKIIVNTSLDIIKHARVRKKYERSVRERHAIEEQASPVENYDAKKMQLEIEKAVATLPGQMRTIFELSRYDGLKYAEIARQLNISVNTVETQMSRALKKLRIKLAAYLAGLLL